MESIYCCSEFQRLWQALPSSYSTWVQWREGALNIHAGGTAEPAL